eukprot:8316106-Ditylum_brightwellii.AAC.1
MVCTIMTQQTGLSSSYTRKKWTQRKVIKMVGGSKDKISKQQVEAAAKSRKLYGIVGFPLDKAFNKMVGGH